MEPVCELSRDQHNEGLIRPSILLQRPWASLAVLKGERKDDLVCCYKKSPYTLKAVTMRSREKFFNLVQGLLSKFSVALRAFAEDFLKDSCKAELSLELYRNAAKYDWE